MEKQSDSSPSKGGRPKGAVNRSTRNAREAIARFVDNSTPHLMEWLYQVAHGIPKVDEAGNLLRDKTGSVLWVVKPNPEGAIKAVSDIAEYHLPKLSRSDVAVVAQVEHSATVDNIAALPTEALQARLLASLGIADNSGQIIDITPEVVPAWMEKGQEKE